MKQLLLASFMALALFATACKSDTAPQQSNAPTATAAPASEAVSQPKEIKFNYEKIATAIPVVSNFNLPDMDVCEMETPAIKALIEKSGMVWLGDPKHFTEWKDEDMEAFKPVAGVAIPTEKGNYAVAFITFDYGASNMQSLSIVGLDKNGKVVKERQEFVHNVCSDGNTYVSNVAIDGKKFKQNQNIDNMVKEVNEFAIDF